MRKSAQAYSVSGHTPLCAREGKVLFCSRAQCACVLAVHMLAVISCSTCLSNKSKEISWIYTLRKGKNDFLILTNTVYACFYLFIFNYSCNPKKQERMRQVNILLSLICDLFSSLLYVLKSVFIIK